MSLPPEEQRAYEELSAAVEKAVDATGMRSEGMININYVVIVEQTGWDEDGGRRTGLVRLHKDGDLPWVSVLGMLRAASLLAERDYTTEGEDS